MWIAKQWQNLGKHWRRSKADESRGICKDIYQRGNPGRAFCKKCLTERATRNLCVALFEEKSDRLLKKMEQSTSGQKPKSLREFMQQQENFGKLDRQQEKLSKNFDSLEW